MTDQILWFATRGAGVVTLILTTSVVSLGLLTAARWQSVTWPRFVTAELHRSLALLSVAFLALHVITAITDPYTSLGVAAAVIPLAPSYRPVAVGLGVISVDLFIGVLATSLIRDRIGLRLWRAIHCLAYGSWPLAVLHSLTAGSDAFSAWMLAITALCVVGVLAALVLRVTVQASPRAALADVTNRSSWLAPQRPGGGR
jgi:methionine sulfoxide reductase heme-binding subunit